MKDLNISWDVYTKQDNVTHVLTSKTITITYIQKSFYGDTLKNRNLQTILIRTCYTLHVGVFAILNLRKVLRVLVIRLQFFKHDFYVIPKKDCIGGGGVLHYVTATAK